MRNSSKFRKKTEKGVNLVFLLLTLNMSLSAWNSFLIIDCLLHIPIITYFLQIFKVQFF